MPHPKEQLQTGRAAQVDTPSLAYQEMWQHWELPIALRRGTRGIRDEATKWLPMEPAETQPQYRMRLNRSVLLPAYDDTIKRLVAKPMSRPVTTEGVLPQPLEPMTEDVDGQGSNLTQFAARVLDASIDRGVSYVLVDFPVVGETLDLRTEQERGVRPNLVHIPAENLIAWKTRQDLNGQTHLAQIRWRETRVEEVGEWGETRVDYIHVYNFVSRLEAQLARAAGVELTGSHELWRRNDRKEEWEQVSNNPISFVGVPLLAHYTDQEAGYMTATPPLEGIADLNLAHYQVSSDHRNILNVVSVAILFRSGLSGEEADSQLVVSPRTSFSSRNPDAKMQWVEHSGRGIEAVERYLRQIEERMEILGMQPLVQQSAQMTATQRVLDEGKTETLIQTWVRDLEAVLREAFEIAGEWIGVEVEEEFRVRIYNDFGLSPRTATDLDALMKARLAGEISRETFLSELRRRSTISEDVDLEEEIRRLEEEGPALGEMGFGAGPPEEGEED